MQQLDNFLLFEYQTSAVFRSPLYTVHRQWSLHSRHDVPCVLHELVQVGNFSPLLKLVEKIHLQMSEFIADAHVQLVVALGGQQGRAQLT